jgi:CDP-glucose 4,6-dehydratase
LSFWKGKRVVVTGGSGLIGTPMFAKLADLGISWGCNLDIPEYDVLDYNDILGGVSRADVCIHLAAISHVEDSRSRRHNTFDVNVRGTYNVLEACLDAGVKSVVVASSNHVYGNQDVFPVPETAPLNQLDTYSASKIAADYIARAYGHNYGLPVAIIRNTNCFGPEDPHSDHLVPGTILSILRGGRPVLRSTGLTKKGYLYVEDVVLGARPHQPLV